MGENYLTRLSLTILATITWASASALAGGLGDGCSSVGPDVIVGDITGPTNYEPANGLDAVSLGTTSCNIGSAWLNWFYKGTDHPIIVSNLYKFTAGSGASRIEQLGMSWLKHTFYARSEILCCPSCALTDGTHLGVGCSDPYTSNRNGEQYFLGPRWQVNAHTGGFVYPSANPSYGGNDRRIQFAVADIENTSPSVRYFGESQYVAPDDAAAGNQNNNVSFRELLGVTDSVDPNFYLTGETQRMRPAIRAWQELDPTVTEVDVQVPDDGLIILGYQVTNLGAGQWHYEYALYNMNSDRCGRSFAIPMPSCVNVYNIGFHDVDYRGGDGPGNVNFSGTDWAVTRTPTTFTWSTLSYAQSPTANALRWGTMYNFRFNANAPPIAATITVGLFTPGTPTTMSIASLGPQPVTAPACPGDVSPPPNGNGFVNVDDLLFIISNWGHLGGPGDIAPPCGNGIVNVDDLLAVINSWGQCH